MTVNDFKEFMEYFKPFRVIRRAFGATSHDGLVLENTSPADEVEPVQKPPRIRLRGAAWKTGAEESAPVEVILEAVPVESVGGDVELQVHAVVGEGAPSLLLRATTSQPLTGGQPGGQTTASSARVRRSSAQVIPNDTDTVVLFDIETFDLDDLHSATTHSGRLTAKVAGTYVVTAQITFTSNATGIRVVAIRKVSGVTLTAQAVQKIDRPGQAGVGYQDTANVTTILHLAVGDYVDVTAYQDSGGSLNLVAAAYFGCEFSMVRVSD